MSLFLVYDAENYEYILQPAGFAVLVILLLALIVLGGRLGRRKADGQRMDYENILFSLDLVGGREDVCTER